MVAVDSVDVLPGYPSQCIRRRPQTEANAEGKAEGKACDEHGPVMDAEANVGGSAGAAAEADADAEAGRVAAEVAVHYGGEAESGRPYDFAHVFDKPPPPSLLHEVRARGEMMDGMDFRCDGGD